MPYTRGGMLRFAVAFALRTLKIHGRKGVPTEEQCYAIGDHVISELRRHGDPWKLDREIPDPPPGAIAYRDENRPTDDD